METLLKATNNALEAAKNNGLIRNIAQDEIIESGDMITIRNKKLVNFGSCSYLGIELDNRLKQEMNNMIERYGSMLSSARVYLSLDAYKQAEELLSEVFAHDALLSSTCTLGHLANIPILIDKNDLVLLDQQVHNSVVHATMLAASKGFKVERVKHNRIDLLEQIIEKNKDKYSKIWYLADGVYSMYGDVAPVEQIRDLLDKYSNFHFYVDDAHGMGWSGTHGRGYVLSKMDYHPKMILVSSLAKGIAAAGGATIIPDPEMRQYVRNCGSTHIFAGPIQPAMLGALNGALKILLSEEIKDIQTSFMNKMKFFNNTAKAYGVPLVPTDDLTPIFYVGIGNQQITYKMFEILEEAGYYVNVAIYPAVSENRSGLRIPITNHHNINQIEGMLSVVADNLPKLLKKENHSIERIESLFAV